MQIVPMMKLCFDEHRTWFEQIGTIEVPLDGYWGAMRENGDIEEIENVL